MNLSKFSFDPTDFVNGSNINIVTNGAGPDNCFMSVLPNADNTAVDIVVGAPWDDRCASAFTKKALVELAAMIMTIAVNMGDLHEKSGEMLQEAREKVLY